EEDELGAEQAAVDGFGHAGLPETERACRSRSTTSCTPDCSQSGRVDCRLASGSLLQSRRRPCRFPSLVSSCAWHSSPAFDIPGGAGFGRVRRAGAELGWATAVVAVLRGKTPHVILAACAPKSLGVDKTL